MPAPRIYILLFALLGHLFCSASASAAELSSQQKRDIIFDCTQLVHDYAYYRDLRDPVGFSNIFSDDARLQAKGHWLEGQDAIAQHVLDDDFTRVSMHLVTSVKIFPIDATNATGVTYAAVADEPRGEGPAAILESFVVVGQYNDKFVLTDEGWKISERAFTVLFRKSQAIN